MTERLAYSHIAKMVRYGEAWEAQRNRAGHTPRRTIIAYVIQDLLRARAEFKASEVA